MAVQLNEIPGIVQLLTVIGIFLAIGALVLVGVQDTQVSTAGITNESVTPVLNTAVSLSRNELLDGSVKLVNNSNAAPLASTDFSVNNEAGSVTVTNNSFVAGGGTVNATFTYKVQDTFFNISQDSIGGLSGFSEFQSLIGLVVAAAVILGLVFVIGV